MTYYEVNPNPPFCSMVRATGLAEVWAHSTDDSKFNQFGWRCTTNENGYKTDTLVGNWCEERFDLKHRRQPECLPSQCGHYFNSVYNTSYNKCPKEEVPQVLKRLTGRHPHSFPQHQPELDNAQQKAEYNSWKTTQRADYIDPRIRLEPLKPLAKKTKTPTPTAKKL